MWIVSSAFDLCCIIAPGLLSALIVVLLSQWFNAHSAVSAPYWIALVLCIDVAHVYSTLFRTYFDKAEFLKRRNLYLTAPLLAWAGGIVLYSFGALCFWRVAAYLAVFHFIRQQYGFMMIYVAREGRKDRALLERLAIYLATIYPLVFWHTHPRAFSWFVENDFVMLPFPWLSRAVGAIYAVTLAAYVCNEGRRWLNQERMSPGKNLFLLATALSWYVGIVVFNGDLAFTLTNVVAHGIPYIGLVWVYQRKKLLSPVHGMLGRVLQPNSVWMYFGILIVLAYVEEGLWDGLIWRERAGVFSFFQYYLPHADGKILAFLVPLLTVPQLTHYILDGFIWKVRRPDPEFRQFVSTAIPESLNRGLTAPSDELDDRIWKVRKPAFSRQGLKE